MFKRWVLIINDKIVFKKVTENDNQQRLRAIAEVQDCKAKVGNLYAKIIIENRMAFLDAIA